MLIGSAHVGRQTAAGPTSCMHQRVRSAGPLGATAAGPVSSDTYIYELTPPRRCRQASWQDCHEPCPSSAPRPQHACGSTTASRSAPRGPPSRSPAPRRETPPSPPAPAPPPASRHAVAPGWPVPDMGALNACALTTPKRAKLVISHRSVPRDAPSRPTQPSVPCSGPRTPQIRRSKWPRRPLRE